MSERNQEIRISLQADEYLRVALDIKNAKDVLKRHGFCVDNLWHIEDVRRQVKHISDNDAQYVLNRALNNENVMETIHQHIGFAIQRTDLKLEYNE